MAGPGVEEGTRAEPQKTRDQLLAEVITLHQRTTDILHDIKDPLGVILGYTGILLQEARTRKTVQRVEALERIPWSAQLSCTFLSRGLELERSMAARFARL